MKTSKHQVGWDDVELGDMITLHRGYDLPSAQRRDGTIPVVSSSGITGYHDETKVQPPGVVTGRYGTLGEVFFVEEPFWPLNTTLYVSDFHGNDERFISYFLQCQGLGARDAASAVPGINRNVLHRLPAKRPPLSTQRKITAILSAYDDLIENNNRRIKLLEELAQRIYREWFIDLRYPGHENVPLVDSERCQIPDGWISGLLREVVYFHIGGGWGADKISSSHTRLARVVRGTDIPRVRRGDVSSCPARYHTVANLRSRLLQKGDIVFEVSGGSTGQPVGRSALISDALLTELGMDAICASFCKLVRSNRDILLPELLNYRFLDAYGSGEIGSYQVQSTGITNLRFSQLLESFPVLIPPMATQSLFVDRVGSMMSAVDLLGIQVRNLRAARDLLLLRVVSGEIDLTDLDIAMPEAAV